MCLHRKSLYLCNHSQVSGEPLTVCQAQRDYQSGNAAAPCDAVETRAHSTIRVSKLCAQCREKQDTVDRQLGVVKDKMAELRRHLNESYDNCMKHLDEAGLDPEDKSEGEGKKTAAEEKEEETVDPVKEFLKKKMMENDSHLMMFSA